MNMGTNINTLSMIILSYICYIPDTVLRALHILTYLIMKTVLVDNNGYQSHLMPGIRRH